MSNAPKNISKPDNLSASDRELLFKRALRESGFSLLDFRNSTTKDLQFFSGMCRGRLYLEEMSVLFRQVNGEICRRADVVLNDNSVDTLNQRLTLSEIGDVLEEVKSRGAFVLEDRVN